MEKSNPFFDIFFISENLASYIEHHQQNHNNHHHERISPAVGPSSGGYDNTDRHLSGTTNMAVVKPTQQQQQLQEQISNR